MAAQGPGPRSFFESLPRVVHEEVSSLLPDEDLADSSKTSRVFKKIIKDPEVWTKVAEKLNVEVTNIQDPKEDVLAYYKKTNENILELFDLRQIPIPRTADPFLQRRMIENYIMDLKDVDDILGHAINYGNIDLIKVILEVRGPILDENNVYRAVLKRNAEIVKLFLDAKVPIHSRSITEAVASNNIEIVKLFVQAQALTDEDYEDYIELAEDRKFNNIADHLRIEFEKKRA